MGSGRVEMQEFDQGTAGSFQLSDESLDAIISAGKPKRIVVGIDANARTYQRDLLQRAFNLSINALFDRKIASEKLAELERSLNAAIRTKSHAAREKRFLRLRKELSDLSDLWYPPPNPSVLDVDRLQGWIAEENQRLSGRGRPSKIWVNSTVSRLCAAFERIYETKPTSALDGATLRFVAEFFSQAKGTVSSGTMVSSNIDALVKSYLGVVSSLTWHDRLKTALAGGTGANRPCNETGKPTGMSVHEHGVILDLMVPLPDMRMG